MLSASLELLECLIKWEWKRTLFSLFFKIFVDLRYENFIGKDYTNTHTHTFGYYPVRISYILLWNKLPQTQWLKTTINIFLSHIVSAGQEGLSWVVRAQDPLFGGRLVVIWSWSGLEEFTSKMTHHKAMLAGRGALPLGPLLRAAWVSPGHGSWFLKSEWSKRQQSRNCNVFCDQPLKVSYFCNVLFIAQVSPFPIWGRVKSKRWEQPGPPWRLATTAGDSLETQFCFFSLLAREQSVNPVGDLQDVLKLLLPVTSR